MIEFEKKISKIIKKIPSGKFFTYGEVAAKAGYPRLARQVGRFLKNLDISKTDLPWWRVVGSGGCLVIKGNWTADKRMQKKLLKQEGLEFVSEFKIKI